MIRTIGSEKYRTEIMNDEEVEVMFEAAMEHNNDDPVEALQDVRLIDTLLHIKRLHFVVHGQIKRTAAGNIRKGSDLYTSMEAVINGRVNNEL
jgi:hypothetical protein